MGNGDETRREVERIARRTNGGEVSNRDLFDLILAVDHDSVLRDEKTTQALTEHCAEAELRDDRLEALERFEKHAVERCAESVQKKVDAAIREADRRHVDFHDATFGQHMDEYSHLTHEDMARRLEEREVILAKVEQMMAQTRHGDPDGFKAQELREAFAGTLTEPQESHETWLVRLLATTLGKLLMVFLSGALGALAVWFIHQLTEH